MGDRANIYLKDSERGGIYLYTHWSGSEWPSLLQEAIAFGKDRWFDEPYLARIITSRVFRDLVDSTSGGGISTMLTDNEYPILCVDLMTGEVGLADPGIDHSDKGRWTDVRSFAEFLALDVSDWDNLRQPISS